MQFSRIPPLRKGGMGDFEVAASGKSPLAPLCQRGERSQCTENCRTLAAARVMSSFQKFEVECMAFSSLGILPSMGRIRVPCLFDRSDRTEPSMINSIGGQHAIGLLTTRDSTLGAK